MGLLNILNPFSKEKDRLNMYKDMFLDDEGQLSEVGSYILADLHEFCHCSATFTGNDAVEIARMSGRREAFNWIFQSIVSNGVDAINKHVIINKAVQENEYE